MTPNVHYSSVQGSETCQLLLISHKGDYFKVPWSYYRSDPFRYKGVIDSFSISVDSLSFIGSG